MKEKKYINPDLEIITFPIEDVIATSDPGENLGGGDIGDLT